MCYSNLIFILFYISSFLFCWFAYICMVFGSIQHSCTLAPTDSRLTLTQNICYGVILKYVAYWKKCIRSCGWFRQSSKLVRHCSRRKIERERERKRDLARQNDGPNSSSFQELYITLVCPLRLLSVTLLQRSTEKNYVPRNTTYFATRIKYNLISFNKFLCTFLR